MHIKPFEPGTVAALQRRSVDDTGHASSTMKILELSNVKKNLRANSRVRNSSHKFKKYKSPLEAAGFFFFLEPG